MSSSEISGINFVFQIRNRVEYNRLWYSWSIYIDTNYWRISIKMKQPENFRLYENKSSDMNKILIVVTAKSLKTLICRSHES
jgi:hypothetical protein